MDRDRQISYIDNVITWCLMGLVFILPFVHTMTIRSVFIFLPFALWLYKMAIRREVIFVRNQLTLPLALFTVTVLISLITAVSPAYTLRELRGEVITDFLIFFVAVNNINKKEQINGIIVSLLAGSLVHGAYSAYSYFSHQWDLLDHSFKVGGFTGGYISYSVFLVTVLPFAVYMAVVNSGVKRIFFTGLILLNLFMLYLTHQRGALIALFVMTLIFLWAVRRRIVCLAVAGMVFIAIIFMPNKLLYHGDAGVDLNADTSAAYGNTINSRVALWKFSLKEIGERPFTGIGFGRHSFSIKYQQFKNTDLWHALNTFVNLTLQLGVQGLAMFLFIIWRLAATYRLGLKVARGDSYYLFLAAFLFTIGFFIRNLFDDHYVDDNAQMFWLLTGIGVALFVNIEKLAYKDFRLNHGLRMREKKAYE
ncbi:MAG: O-antigen ligase family protein [Deltaproteobacteria bacterium]|nr:O-antigen ligase family protein [Deltaproteobacteria bacterium]